MNAREEGEKQDRFADRVAAKAEALGSLLKEKNKAYGNSFADCDRFLRLLWPHGVPVNRYGDMLVLVRMFDKMKRVASSKGAFSESPYKDIAGYGLLKATLDDDRKEENEQYSASGALFTPEEIP